MKSWNTTISESCNEWCDTENFYYEWHRLNKENV